MNLKSYPTLCCLQETHLKYRCYTGNLKIQEWKKIYYANINQKIVGMSILISDKVDFKAKEKKGQEKAL